MCRTRQTWTLPDMSRLVRWAKAGAKPDRHGHTPLGVSGCPVRPCPGQWRVGEDHQRSRRFRVGPSPLIAARGTRSPDVSLHMKNLKSKTRFLPLAAYHGSLEAMSNGKSD